MMDHEVRERLAARANIIKAMAHPKRLFIVEELAKTEQCVNELTEKTGADVSTVSKHLSILRNAGIVKDRKQKTHMYYYLLCPCVLNFFSCVESVLQSSLNQQKCLL